MIIFGIWRKPSSFREESSFIKYFARKDHAEMYCGAKNDEENYCDYVYSVKEINVE